MVKIMKPRVGMIFMPESEVSRRYRSIVTPSWNNAGYEIESHTAITPQNYDLYKEKLPVKLNFGVKKGGRNKGKPLTDTEKAIWYSHIQMWSIAARKANPFIIIEHDILLLKHIDHAIIDKYPIVGLSHCGLLSKFPEKGYRVSAGGAYLLKNDLAKKMIQELPKEININSDGYIHSYITKYGAFRHEHTTQIYIPEFGSTINHD